MGVRSVLGGLAYSFGEMLPETCSAAMLFFTIPNTAGIYEAGGVPALAIETGLDLYFSYVLYRGILRGDAFNEYKSDHGWPDPLKSVYRRIKCKIEGKPYSFE